MMNNWEVVIECNPATGVEMLWAFQETHEGLFYAKPVQLITQRLENEGLRQDVPAFLALPDRLMDQILKALVNRLTEQGFKPNNQSVIEGN